MDKEDVLCMFNGILFSHKKEGNPAVLFMVSVNTRQRKTNAARYHLYVDPKTKKQKNHTQKLRVAN